MQPSEQSNPYRSIAMFVLIGAVLLAVVIFGVRWAKGRSDSYAQASNKPQTVAQEPQKSEPKPADQQNQSQSGSNNNSSSNPTDTTKQNQQTPAPTNSSSNSSQQSQTNNNSTTTSQTPQTSSTSTVTPSHVPSTGAGDMVITTIGYAALAVAGVYYLQSRRRLERLN